MCANFVDVVGFQLERVHTGVIAWLLGGEPLPLPLEERGAVLRKLEPRLSDLGDLATLKAKREYSLGRRRRIDLVLETSFKNDKKAFLLIEFKVDSDVYLSQLEESERDFSAHEPNKPLLFVIVLALGAAQFTLKHQLPEIEKKRYRAVDLPHALQIFSNLSIAGRNSIYDDWVASLVKERDRNAQIDTALAGVEVPHDAKLTARGYRIGFPVFYAYYHKIRKHLEEGPFRSWAIYSGSNNPVMNWEKGWITVGREPEHIKLYWEFNWEALCLKAEIEGESAERWAKMRPAVIELCKGCSVAGRMAGDRRGKWVTAYKWEFEFCQEAPAAIAAQTVEILSQLHERIRCFAESPLGRDDC